MGPMNQPDPIVFVIDDDASFRRSAERLIQSAGFKVNTFATGQSFCARDGQMGRPVWCSMCGFRP
jgi:FixJ family two-component response regulator